MKVCSKCKEKKELNNFYFKNRKKLILSSYCKECHKNYINSHYHKNPAPYKLRLKLSKEMRRKRNQNFILNYLKSHPCIDCGETDPVVLEFDHLRDKKFLISFVVRDGRSLHSIKKEITKCEVRCANCHRRKTAKDYNFYKARI